MEIIMLENKGKEKRICVSCGDSGDLQVKVNDGKEVYYLCSGALDAAIQDYVRTHR